MSDMLKAICFLLLLSYTLKYMAWGDFCFFLWGLEIVRDPLLPSFQRVLFLLVAFPIIHILPEA